MCFGGIGGDDNSGGHMNGDCGVNRGAFSSSTGGHDGWTVR